MAQEAAHQREVDPFIDRDRGKAVAQIIDPKVCERELRGTDDGVRRRAMLVPFEVQISELARDPLLTEKVIAETPGILSQYLVLGLTDYLESGLAAPKIVRSAAAEYRAGNGSIGEFLTSYCVITGGPEHYLSGMLLLEGFNDHLAERGESKRKLTTVAQCQKVTSERWRHPETGQSLVLRRGPTQNIHRLAADRRVPAPLRRRTGGSYGAAHGEHVERPEPLLAVKSGSVGRIGRASPGGWISQRGQGK